MKKIALSMIFALFLAVGIVAAVPNWNIAGVWTWVQYDCVGCTNSATHTMTINVENFNACTGDFSGTGVQVGDTTNTWTVVGNVDKDNIKFKLTCDPRSHYAGYILDAIGTIASSGTTMEGSGTDNYGRTTPWTASGVTATAIDKTDTDSDGTIDICDSDDDNDGVLDVNDFCAGTTADGSWGVSWGTNRWQVNSDFKWYQNKPAGKGTTVATYGHDLSYTYGCNGHQILQMLNDKLGNVMNGHWKYGLSSSVLDDFHKDLNDGVLDGMYLIDTVTVPANKETDTLSTVSLVAGKNYILKAHGTANAGDGIEFDAKYSFRTPTSTMWTDAVSTYEYYGTNLLDLYVNDVNIDWGTYDITHTHTYTYNYVPSTNGMLPLKIYDIYYFNNVGQLSVDLFAQV